MESADNDEFRLNKPHIVYFYFAVGMVAAIAFRLITILNKTNPEWVRTFWYISVVSYAAFFRFRYMISKRRKEIIKKYGLVEKLSSPQELTADERKAAGYIISSISVSKEMLNYYAVFILSVIAIVLDIAINGW